MSDGTTFIMDQVVIDDSDDDFDYTGVAPVDSADDSDTDDDKSTLAATKRALNKSLAAGGVHASASASAGTGSKTLRSGTAELTTKPEVIDDFIMNFLVKTGMSKTADTFQTELFELRQKGELSAEDLVTVPDVYQQTQALDSQVAAVRRELEDAKATADKYRSTWDKLRKERDYHRQHHQRVLQEKNALLAEMKRLKEQYAKYKPALEQQQEKYDAAVRARGLKAVECDQLKARVASLQATIAHLRGKTSDGRPSRRGQRDASGSGSANNNNSNAEEGEYSGDDSVGASADRRGSNGHIRVGASRAATAASRSSLGGGGGRRAGSRGTPARLRTAGGASRGSPRPPKLMPGSLPVREKIDYEPLRVSTVALTNSIPGHEASIAAVATHPSKALLASVSDDYLWKVWTVPGGELALQSGGAAHNEWLASCVFHPLGSHLATSSGDGTIKLWNFAKQGCTMTLSDHQAAVWGVDFHHTGDFLASASMDCTARIFDLKSRKCVLTFRQHVNSVNAVQFEPLRNCIATASGDKTVSTWDCNSSLCTATLLGHDNAVNHVAYDRSGTRLVSSDADGVVKVWDLRTASCLASVATGGPTLAGANDVVFDLSGNVVAAASEDGTVKFIDVEEGVVAHEVAVSNSAVQGLALDSSGTYIVAGCSDGYIKVIQ